MRIRAEGYLIAFNLKSASYASAVFIDMSKLLATYCTIVSLVALMSTSVLTLGAYAVSPLVSLLLYRNGVTAGICLLVSTVGIYPFNTSRVIA